MLTCCRSLAPRAVNVWRKDLEGKGRKKLASSIADPDQDADAFPGWQELLDREAELAQRQMDGYVNGDADLLADGEHHAIHPEASWKLTAPAVPSQPPAVNGGGEMYSAEEQEDLLA